MLRIVREGFRHPKDLGFEGRRERFHCSEAVIEFSRLLKAQDSNRNTSWRPEKKLGSQERKSIKAK